MPNRDSNGLKYKPTEKIGMDELQWLQDEADERRRTTLLGQAAEPGWLASYWPHGQDSLGWNVTDPGANGTPRLQLSSGGSPFGPNRRRAPNARFVGVSPNGRMVELDLEDGTTLRDADGEPIVVPDDAVWYTLVAVPVLTSRAPGRLTMTAGSAVVTGTRTGFRRFADATDARATRIRISAADGDTVAGNEGEYRFSSITDDTTATLDRPAIADETGVQFRAMGDFLGATPADPDIHSNLRTTWELRARTVTPPTDAIIAYDVKRDTGIQPGILFIDRRHAQIYRPLHTGYNRRWMLSPILEAAAADPWLIMSKRRDNVLATASDFQNVCVCPASVGSDTSAGAIVGDVQSGLLAVVAEDTGATFNLRVREYVPWASPQWRNPNGGGSVSINPAITLAEDHQSAIVCVPSASGWTHAFFVTDSGGAVQMYRSDDNGATWDSPVEIWDPDSAVAGDAASHLSVVLTRTGRLILAACYVPTATGDGEIRYVSSDDYGDTWSTNGDAGTGLIAVAGASLEHPSIVEDDEGNLWTAFDRGDQVRMVRGSALNNPAPDSETPAGGWRVSAENTSDSKGKASLVAAPDGTVIVVYQSIVNGGNHDVWAVVTSRGRMTWAGFVASMQDTATGSFLSMAVATDANGIVHLLREYIGVNRSCVDEPFTLEASARAGYGFPQ